jgi:hypothetical protein
VNRRRLDDRALAHALEVNRDHGWPAGLASILAATRGCTASYRPLTTGAGRFMSATRYNLTRRTAMADEAPQPSEWEIGNAQAARDVLRAFERRARELDGADAVTGLAAINARYYPPDRGSPPGEQAMMNLRTTLQRFIGHEL